MFSDLKKKTVHDTAEKYALLEMKNESIRNFLSKHSVQAGLGSSENKTERISKAQHRLSTPETTDSSSKRVRRDA